jgi:hypothetical protein
LDFSVSQRASAVRRPVLAPEATGSIFVGSAG